MEIFVLKLLVVRKLGESPRVVVSTAAFHARVLGSVPGRGGVKETKMFLPHPRVKFSIVGSLRDREVACSASDRQGSNFAGEIQGSQVKFRANQWMNGDTWVVAYWGRNVTLKGKNEPIIIIISRNHLYYSFISVTE